MPKPYSPRVLKGLAALAIPGTNDLRVYLISANTHIVQLSSANNTTWTGFDLTKQSSGPLATATNGIAAFATTPNNQLHVFYISGTHVNQLFLPTPATTWQNSDLTAIYGGSPANGTSGMAGFSLQNFQYLYFVAN